MLMLPPPDVHYELVYIRHLDGHADEDPEDEMPAYGFNITLTQALEMEKKT